MTLYDIIMCIMLISFMIYLWWQAGRQAGGQKEEFIVAYHAAMHTPRPTSLLI